MKPRVLIVEDEVLLAWSLGEILSLIGCEVAGIAGTVNDALCLAENTKPDLAIVDVRLAGQRDGIEGAELLRQQFGLPVIFVTGEIDKETERRASDFNPVSYLRKPVHGQQLVDAVRTAVGEERTEQRGAEKRWAAAIPGAVRVIHKEEVN
jgi:two-component system, response regulator PdtaR